MASYALALRAGFVSDGSWVEIAAGIFKVATPAALGVMGLALIGWRWAPPVVQNLLFPYLGGLWTGTIEFLDKSGATVSRDATLEVAHTPTSIRFALSTVESTSETLVVHARKVAVLGDLVKLVYIYEVERREGYPGAGDRYRGCAFLDVRLGAPRTMTGSYMAGPDRSGVLRMQFDSNNPWWKVWR